MERVLIRRTLDSPFLHFFASEIVLSAPQIDLGNTVADGFSWIEGCAPLEHSTCMIEQADMRQDRSQAAVGMRQVLLKSNCTLQFRNCLDMLEVFRWPPE